VKTHIERYLSFSVLVASFVIPGALHAQDSSPVPIKDVLEQRGFPPLTRTQLSPDGEWVAYTLKRDAAAAGETAATSGKWHTSTGVPVPLQGSDIELTNLTTGQTRNLTRAQGSSWAPVWSPDGTQLAFYSDRGGVAQLWLWDRTGDEFRQVSNLTVWVYMNFEAPEWTPSGTSLIVPLLPVGMSVDAAERPTGLVGRLAPGDPELKEPGTTVAVYAPSIDKVQIANDSDLSKGDVFGDLAIVDVKVGKVIRIASGFKPMWFKVAPNGRKVAFTSWFGRDRSNGILLVDLVVVDLPNRLPQVVASRIGTINGVNFSWSPDSQSLAYVALTLGDKTLTEIGACFVVSTTGGEPKTLTPPSHPNFAGIYMVPFWDESGQNIYLLSLGNNPLYSEQYDSLWKLPVTGDAWKEVARASQGTFREVVSRPGTGRFWSPDGGRSMILMSRDGNTLKDGFDKIGLNSGSVLHLYREDLSYGVPPNNAIWSMDVSDDHQCAAYRAGDVAHSVDVRLACVSDLRTSRRLTTINPQYEHRLMGKSQPIQWRSLDGQVLRGALLLPSGYQEGKRYPLLVWQYPTADGSVYLNEFGFETDVNMQIFATRGYAVLFPNVPASPGSLMQDIPKAVIPAVDRVVEMGIADPARLGLMGHSFGGYGVLSVIVQTTRFEAAVDISGADVNLIDQYGTMPADGERSVYQYLCERWMGGTLWQNREQYIENSPIFYLDRVTTPLLIIHGSSDLAAPSSEADQLFVFLRRLDKQVEYAKYSGEGHGIASVANQLDYLTRTVKWFDKYLKSNRY